MGETPWQFGIKDRFIASDRAGFRELIEGWDKKIKFADHSPEMVPMEVLETARVGLASARKTLLNAHVIADTTKCAEILAPLPRHPENLEAFKQCLRDAVR